jgi:hypothetical protein
MITTANRAVNHATTATAAATTRKRHAQRAPSSRTRGTAARDPLDEDKDEDKDADEDEE